MLKALFKSFVAKCDIIPEEDKTKVKIDGEIPGKDDGYFALDMYPERRGEQYKPSVMRRLLLGAGKDIARKRQCQEYVYNAAMHQPLVKLLINALESSGCPVDLPRLVQCEICDLSVQGGYDSEYNQVVLCYNSLRSQMSVEGTLIHELIHVFDHCRTHLDIRNHEHIACTEIRAANLLHGNYLGCMLDGWVPMFTFKNRHRDCIRARAIQTMMTSRKLSAEEAVKVVDKVFERCYADLEPFGRRIASGYDAPMIEREGKYFGY